MVNNAEQQLDYIFQALSDSTRRAMLARLAQGQCIVSQLPNPYGVSKAAISKHLNALHRAKLIEKTRDGRVTHCSTDPRALDPVLELLEELGQFWSGQLGSLEQYFAQNPLKETRNEHSKKSVSKSRNKKNNSR